MAQTILYYPTINIQDSAWLRNAVLYWDEVSSIVPYEDYPNFSPEVLFLQRSGVYKAVYPQKLFSSEFAEDFCNSIVKRIAAYEARTVNNENTKQVRKIYSSRSSAVHGNKTKDNLESAVEESANLLTRILRRCAELNKLPDVDNLAFRVDKQKQGIKCKILVP